MDFSGLEERIGVIFKNKDLLREAVTHCSYLNENKQKDWQDYERLELLGDSVLNFVIITYLFENFPDKKEGDLTRMRGFVASGKVATKVSIDIGIEDFLLLSKGESRDKGRAREIILADVFEALIGAVYLDQGLEAARKMIDTLLFVPLEGNIRVFDTPKSILQELVQEQYHLTPYYCILEETGPEHDRGFVSGVYMGERLLARGRGRSKKKSEEDAAEKALAILRNPKK